MSEGVQAAGSAAASTLFGIGSVGQIFLMTSLQYIWDMISQQQIVILFNLFDMVPPNSVKAVFESLMQIAAFEILPMEKIFTSVEIPVDGNPYSEKFE